MFAIQYQEAKDLQIPFPERNRPKVPTKPQTCSPRNHKGIGVLSLIAEEEAESMRVFFE
jgi:hypothetical protein